MKKKPLLHRLAVLGLGGLLALGAAGARAEGQIRIADQFGIVYLLLDVAKDQKLIEKHGKAQGLDIAVSQVTLSGGSAMNDALLSGSIDIAGAGVGPLLTLWDRTLGKQNVRGVASLGNFPYYLVSTNPAVKTIADFSDKDHIALPAVGVSVQSRILQLASSRLWGDAQHARLDKISVALPHPEATAAISKGGTEITAHFANPPFQEQELAANPAAKIVLKSYDVLDGPDPQRGLVFQQHTLFPWKTVLDNVAYGLKMKGVPRAQREHEARTLLELVGLAGFERRYPRELSGGMQQRVEIARVLINHPRVLLMDEPFGALDALTRAHMQELLLDLWTRMRTTILFVTHDIDEALFLADRVLILSPRPGRVVEELRVGFERPRQARLLTHPEFVALKRRCLQLLRHDGDSDTPTLGRLSPLGGPASVPRYAA